MHDKEVLSSTLQAYLCMSCKLYWCLAGYNHPEAAIPAAPDKAGGDRCLAKAAAATGSSRHGAGALAAAPTAGHCDGGCAVAISAATEAGHQRRPRCGERRPRGRERQPRCHQRQTREWRRRSQALSALALTWWNWQPLDLKVLCE